MPSISAKLPNVPSRLFGREHLLERALSLLSSEHRLLSLIGPGGVGKTHMALAIAHASTEAFPQGVDFVDLSPVSDPISVPDRIAQSLNIKPEPRQSALDLIVDFLEGQRLLVLDNFEQVQAASPIVAELLDRCPKLHVLVTSREALHLRLEQSLRLEPLELPTRYDLEHVLKSPAVQLFTERLKSGWSSFLMDQDNAITIAKLCQQLDGLPLALELIAARTRLLGLDTVLARLQQHLPIPAAPQADQPARHQSLERALDWSYQSLSDEEQRVFRRLAVFVGGWDLAAAEAVAGFGADTLSSLTSLAEKHLVRIKHEGISEARFELLETVRAYGLGQLRRADELEDAQQSMVRYFLTLTEEHEDALFGPDQSNWFDRFDLEQPNLFAALRWTLNTAHTELGLRLCGAVGRFWAVRGYSTDARSLMAQLLEQAENAPEPVPDLVKAGALIVMAGSERMMNNIPEVQRLLERCLALCQASDPGLASDALGALGTVAADYHQDYVGAQGHFQAALEFAAKLQDTSRQGFILTGLGGVQMLNGQFEEAKQTLELSLEFRRASGDQVGIASTFQQLGRLALKMSDPKRAQSLFEEALRLNRDLQNQLGIVNNLSMLGQIAWTEGHPSSAAAFWLEGLSISQQMGYRRGMAVTLEWLAVQRASLGQDQNATQMLAAATELRHQPDLRAWPAEQQKWLEHLRQSLGTTFDTQWLLGRTMPIDRVIALAQQHQVPRKPTQQPLDLSPRELEVLRLLQQGYSNKRIGQALSISDRTAAFHVKAICRKLGARNRSQALALAFEYNLL
jgi:predicted ATPase/DNA-binding CsgD family transcriptional regulator